ncbi:MAG: hypothetical protein Ct9H90mP22_5940 [Gammaproteobacteria bacterium]|nr:MAG: hypothetical protein Ct9H90mP22_5940 [Gammaproteobacteria bacterium]
MIKRYFHNGINRNFSIAMIWINGGSTLDSMKKGHKSDSLFIAYKRMRGI